MNEISCMPGLAWQPLENVVIMRKPFEGLLGDSCETRLLQFLLPMYGIEFVMADLEEEVQFTRQSISKALKKFSDRGMITIRKDGRTWYYSINENSPLVKRIEDFHNSLVESIVGEEKIREFEETYEKSIRASGSRVPKQAMKKVMFRHDTSRDTAYGVAEPSCGYPKKKRLVS